MLSGSLYLEVAELNAVLQSVFGASGAHMLSYSMYLEY